MRIVDANVLLYAVNPDSQHHESAKDWLERSLSGSDQVGFAWNALLAFVRLATKQVVFAHPLTPDEAMGLVDDWLRANSAEVVNPGPAHALHLRALLSQVGTAANLTNDAHLAALALEHGASVVTYDRDFARFPGLRSASPDDLLA